LGLTAIAPSQATFLVPAGVANGPAIVRFGATSAAVMIGPQTVGK
jgi:hypothetical protein